MNELTYNLDSPNPSTQTCWFLEDWRSRPRSTSSPSRSSFPPHSLEGFEPRVSMCRKPRLVDFFLVCVSCNRFVVCLRAPNLVLRVCLKLIVKAPDSALKDFDSGRWTSPLWQGSSRIGWCLSGVEQACCGKSHTPPTRRTPLKMRNSGIHPCLHVIPLRFPLSLAFACCLYLA